MLFLAKKIWIIVAHFFNLPMDLPPCFISLNIKLAKLFFLSTSSVHNTIAMLHQYDLPKGLRDSGVIQRYVSVKMYRVILLIGTEKDEQITNKHEQ